MATVAVGVVSPFGLAYDSGMHEGFVANGGSDDVSVIGTRRTFDLAANESGAGPRLIPSGQALTMLRNRPRGSHRGSP